jgi:hypothetical protein
MSDHSVITLELKTGLKKVRGKGTWKFNASLLKEADYVSAINLLITECIEKYKDMPNSGLVWDTVKMEIRGKTISYASHRAIKK